MSVSKYIIVIILALLFLQVKAQQSYIAGFEMSVDQDYFSDFLRDENNENRNYAISLRLGIYGEIADNIYLGLPWVRQKVDGFLIDNILYNSGFREETESHNFVFITNGFSPSLISDEVAGFQLAVDGGYDLATDRPFSSFTGFRSTRRIQGSKRFAHTARQLDLAITSSFTFGFASLGLVQGVENIFGKNRPDANLWDRNDDASYPTGQVMRAPSPMFMYSISAEAVIWKPIKKVLVQVRPEVNLGYYTNIGVGIDFGKVMNVDRHVDNLSYTDTNNPGLISVNNENIGFSLVAGLTSRVAFYNAHVNGYYGLSKGDNFRSFGGLRKFVFEGYIGAKLQLFKKVEFNFSINQRTTEFTNAPRPRPMWGTFGVKYLMAPEGEGCFDY